MTDQRKLSTKDIARAAEQHDEGMDPPAMPAERATTDVTVKSEPRSALFPDDEVHAFRTRWEAIQTGFVDEPRTAVSEADALVAHVVTRVAEVFSKERSTLEQQWGRGDRISTEDLRVTLRRYRAFFDRLLSA